MTMEISCLYLGSGHLAMADHHDGLLVAMLCCAAHSLTRNLLYTSCVICDLDVCPCLPYDVIEM